jgi:hypothetical protein
VSGIVVQVDAFIFWAEATLAPRVLAMCEDVRKRVQRSEELVRNSRVLLGQYEDAQRRRGTFREPYVLRMSNATRDKLLAIVNRDLERTVDVLPNTYHEACWRWFNELSILNRMTADLASHVYLKVDAGAAERIAAELPRAPAFPFGPAAARPTPLSRADPRPRQRQGRRRLHG